MEEYESDMSSEGPPEEINRQKAPFLYDYYLSVPLGPARTPSTSSKIGKTRINSSSSPPLSSKPSSTSS